MKKINRKIILSLMILLASSFAFAKEGNESAGVERYAIYIGSNIGGKNNQRLLYAGSDAISFQKTMSEIGGISQQNSILLLDPTKDDVDNAMQTISALVDSKKSNLKRTEFVFYYSGHSDEYSLLLGKTTYGYSELKKAISEVPTDVHVVILDSCYSGNFIRSKGGQRQKPFLMDDSSVVKGHAYLSSSSSQESSQESDEIGSSFFTNAMITGLRGAADSSGDKKVTLNELYSYAFNETLSKTENTSTGPQHPNYNITLVGSGDLVLSDISNSDSILMISKEITGRVIIRDKNGKLVSEINKTSEKPVYLALESGQYGVTVIGENATLQGNFTLSPKKTYALSNTNLSPAIRVANRTRGDDGEEVTDEEAEDEDEGFDFEYENRSEDDFAYVPFMFSFVCDEFHLALNKDIITSVGIGLLRVHAYEADGALVAGIGSEAVYINGFQGGGIYSFAMDVNGAQGAGVFNFARDVHGVQGSGVFNFARDVTGVQGSGVINIAHDVTYVQGAGVVNVAAGKVNGVQGSGVANFAMGLRGVQGAGIANITWGESSGVQGAGIINIAKGDFDGVQVGLVNYCSGESGFQLGLINISKNGVCEVGASLTTDERARITFNSGMRYLYAVFGCAVPLDADYDDEYYLDDKYVDVIMGLGTRFKFAMLNFDLEVMANEVLIPKEDTQWYMSTRASVGVTPIKHLNVFAGFTMAFESEYNRGAFERHKSNMKFTKRGITVHSEFDFGVRFSFN